MKQIKDFFKGLIIGFGKIIPGVSGSVFAILFGVYELIIESLSDLKKLKEHFNVLFPIGIGIVFAIVFGSNIIDYLLNNYYLVSMSFFIGLMSFELIPLIKNTKLKKCNLHEFIISFSFVIILYMVMFIKFDVANVVYENNLREFISLMLCGFIDAASTIIPGVSGSAILMILGYYEIIISSLANINIIVLIPFLLGFIVGIILISKMINYMFKSYRNIANISILLLSFTSILYLIVKLFIRMSIDNIFICLFSFIVGLFISFLIEHKTQ